MDNYQELQKTMKRYKPFFLLIPFITVFFIEFVLDNDFYWIYKTGEYICNNGFPTKDFLTMHSNMDIVVQQWVFDVLSYKLYSWLGAIGPMLVVVFLYILFNVLFYKLCSLLSDKTLLISLIMFIADSFMLAFTVTRPQMFTYCIILAELICLEKYAKTGSCKSLFMLPLLSVLGVNIHASMWTMQFIVLLPYFVSAIPLKINGKSVARFKLLPLVITALAMVACGFLNPYGFKGLAFIFTTSVGGKVDNFIMELKPLSLYMDIDSILDFAPPVLVAACYLFNRKGKTELRYALLTMGTMAMMFMYIKLIPYFIICSFPFLLVFIDNLDFYSVIKRLDSKGAKRKIGNSLKVVIIALVGVIYALLIAVGISDTAEFVRTNGENKSVRVMDITIEQMQKDIDENGVKDVRLYNGFNAGAYLEFKGYKTYIDPRADNFIVDSNHDFDYLVEYRNLQTGKIDCMEVFEKYDFNYFFVEKGTDRFVYLRLKDDSDYSLVYENAYYACFKK